MCSAIEVQLQVHGTGGTDGADGAVVGAVLPPVLALCQPPLVLAAHVVRLQVDSTGGGDIARGAVVRPTQHPCFIIATRGESHRFCGSWRGSCSSGTVSGQGWWTRLITLC